MKKTNKSQSNEQKKYRLEVYAEQPSTTFGGYVYMFSVNNKTNKPISLGVQTTYVPGFRNGSCKLKKEFQEDVKGEFTMNRVLGVRIHMGMQDDDSKVKSIVHSFN